MAYEQKEGYGNLFKNENATPENNQPVENGKVELGGVLYEIAVWGQKKAKTSDKIIRGFHVQKWKAKEKSVESDSVSASTPAPFDSDVPF